MLFFCSPVACIQENAELINNALRFTTVQQKKQENKETSINLETITVTCWRLQHLKICLVESSNYDIRVNSLILSLNHFRQSSKYLPIDKIAINILVLLGHVIVEMTACRWVVLTDYNYFQLLPPTIPPHWRKNFKSSGFWKENNDNMRNIRPEVFCKKSS